MKGGLRRVAFCRRDFRIVRTRQSWYINSPNTLEDGPQTTHIALASHSDHHKTESFLISRDSSFDHLAEKRGYLGFETHTSPISSNSVASQSIRWYSPRSGSEIVGNDSQSKSEKRVRTVMQAFDRYVVIVAFSVRGGWFVRDAVTLHFPIHAPEIHALPDIFGHIGLPCCSRTPEEIFIV